MVDFSNKMASVRALFRELEAEMNNPAIFQQGNRFAEVSSEHRRLGTLIKCYDRFEEVKDQIIESKEMIQAETDQDFIAEVKEELASLEQELPDLEQEMKILIIPPNPADSRNSIVEIRPAAGGDEAALFADELMRMYITYAAKKNWKVEVMEHDHSDIGGLKNVAFLVKGENVFRELVFESGVHRVQRVPTTESQGRIHTSTVTVAVLPEAEEVDIEIKKEDLDIVTTRSGGAGGQCVNTTDSAVQITHKPTGIFVKSQQERSQHKNRDIAMQILRSRLLEIKVREEAEKMAAHRKGQVGTGDRSERIRTYNYPQNRISDHRYGLTYYDLPNMILGDIGKLFHDILTIEAEQRLAEELGENA